MTATQPPSSATPDPACELCASPGGMPVWSEPGWRLVRVEDAAFPGFYRLIRDRHLAEFSQLAAEDRRRCVDLLAWAEGLVIGHLRPTKVNLASLGNAVPHLHWHVVARFDWDSHFPGSVWAQAQRVPPAERMAEVVARRPALEVDLGRLARPT